MGGFGVCGGGHVSHSPVSRQEYLSLDTGTSTITASCWDYGETGRDRQSE